MLDEAHYAAVLNFFYFLLLDEGLALSASYKAVRGAQKKLKRSPSSSIEIVLINSMTEVLKKYLARKKQPALQPPRSQWTGASPEFLGAWKEYMRQGDFEAGEILVLRYILGYPVVAISDALKIPAGTVYFRIGRGLESFSKGSFLQPGGKK